MGSIYTDLAMEARELHRDIPGVSEENESDGKISISRIEIETDEAAKMLEKQRGRYITLDAPELSGRELTLFEAVSSRLCDELKALIPDCRENATVLVVGLGNRFITPDSLGPRVIEKIYVTRHITEYLPDAIDHPIRSICAISPGVLGVTGMETTEVVSGVTEHIKPDLIIAIDSLASRRAARISTTLQLTNTGISPGSGVGNIRSGLNGEALGLPVIAIGVPLVVFASTISQDTISLIANETGLHSDEEKLKELAEKVINEHMGPMIVTPKDIDTIVNDMAQILADGINLALLGSSYDEIRSLTT